MSKTFRVPLCASKKFENGSKVTAELVGLIVVHLEAIALGLVVSDSLMFALERMLGLGRSGDLDFTIQLASDEEVQ